jgi:hypothetical protein
MIRQPSASRDEKGIWERKEKPIVTVKDILYVFSSKEQEQLKKYSQVMLLRRQEPKIDPHSLGKIVMCSASTVGNWLCARGYSSFRVKKIKEGILASTSSFKRFG